MNIQMPYVCSECMKNFPNKNWYNPCKHAFTQSNHTPGPWVISVRQAHQNVRDPQFWEKDVIKGGIRIARCAATSKEDVNANARLIAAAPELLEACKYALERFPDNSPFTQAVTVMLREAIQKVEGN